MFDRLTQVVADSSCAINSFNGLCTNLPSASASTDNLHRILTVVFSTFAVVAVLIIVIAALNIITAGGDPAKVAKARGTIIFALVGLAVAVTADAIVALVLGRLHT